MPFEDELRRAYTILRAEDAEMLNYRSIEAWEKEGYINAEERRELIALNTRLYKFVYRR